jgi:hypothetical protein
MGIIPVGYRKLAVAATLTIATSSQVRAAGQQLPYRYTPTHTRTHARTHALSIGHPTHAVARLCKRKTKKNRMREKGTRTRRQRERGRTPLARWRERLRSCRHAPPSSPDCLPVHAIHRIAPRTDPPKHTQTQNGPPPSSTSPRPSPTPPLPYNFHIPSKKKPMMHTEM